MRMNKNTALENYMSMEAHLKANVAPGTGHLPADVIGTMYLRSAAPQKPRLKR